MLRQNVHARTSFAALAAERAAAAGPMRQLAARTATTIGRLLVTPFAAVAAALAGLLFALLLPICGIATIAEGFAKASWRFVRETFAHVPHPPARRI